MQFLQALIQYSPELRSALQHTVAVKARCRKCGLYDHINIEESIVDLSVPISLKSLKISNLLVLYKEWTQSNKDNCLHCHCMMEVSKELIN